MVRINKKPGLFTSRRLNRRSEKRLRQPRWLSINRSNNRICVACEDCNFINADRVQRLSHTLARMITPQTRTIELDLRQVVHADTKLIAGLVLAIRMARKCGVNLEVIPSDQVSRLLQMFRLEEAIAA